MYKNYFLIEADKNLSKAATILGACGAGALISNFNPASSIALAVLPPKAPTNVQFCLNFGKLSYKLLTPLGVKKQITSNSTLANTSLISLLIVRYINAN